MGLIRAAAIGAAVLLRERLGFASSAAKARRHLRREQPSGVIAFFERRWPRRGGLFATLLLLVASTGLGIVKGGHLEQFVAAVSEARNALANSAGFRITSVGINGRKQLTQDEVLAIGGVNGHSSLLFLDAEAVRDKLKANPWIGDATILKLYPNRLQIDRKSVV